MIIIFLPFLLSFIFSPPNFLRALSEKITVVLKELEILKIYFQTAKNKTHVYPKAWWPLGG